MFDILGSGTMMAARVKTRKTLSRVGLEDFGVSEKLLRARKPNTTGIVMHIYVNVFKAKHREVFLVRHRNGTSAVYSRWEIKRI